MRICQITTIHPIDDVRVFYRQCSTLAQKGHEVHLVMPTETQIKNGVIVHGISRPKSRLVRMLFMPWVAMRKALATKADVYHYHDPEIMPAGFFMRWVLGKRMVYDIHEAVPLQILGKEYMPRWLRPIASNFYKVAEKILSAGQELVLANENCLPDYPPRALAIRNFPIYRAPANMDGDWQAGRDQPPVLLYVGKVTEQRGAMLYLDLARGLKDRGFKFRLLIVGPYDKDYGKKLFDRRRELGVEDCTEIPGLILNEQAMTMVSRATIGLCMLMPVPNFSVILATKLIEYMMLGTPILASNFKQWRMYVDDERSGRTADPTNVEEVVRVCAEMLSNPAELAEMGHRGVAAVKDRYTWDSELAALEQLYQRMIAARP